MKPINSILIVNTFGIGDVLFSTPIIKILAERFPEAKINYICNQRTEHVLKNNTCLNEIMVFEKDFFRDMLKSSKIGFLKEFVFGLS